MQRAIKNVILWNYRRTSWQYDVLCVLILAFIFFTPKSWFEGKERQPLTTSAESSKTTRLIVSTDAFASDLNENARLQRVREISGNPNAQITAFWQKAESDGKIYYEIELR